MAQLEKVLARLRELWHDGQGNHGYAYLETWAVEVEAAIKSVFASGSGPYQAVSSAASRPSGEILDARHSFSRALVSAVKIIESGDPLHELKPEFRPKED